MFQLAIIKDTIPIHPQSFGEVVEQALISELNKKYANRVLHDVGLCMCVFDISQAGEGKVRYGDGFLWYKVVFRLVVFRPFSGEVLVGTIRGLDRDGIRVSLTFFDDIYIPSVYLPTPSAFDSQENAFFWLPESELTASHELLDSPIAERLYIRTGDVIKVRVESDEFFDEEPGPKGEMITGKAPYSVVCSMSEQGLGPLDWWNDQEEEESEEG